MILQLQFEGDKFRSGTIRNGNRKSGNSELSVSSFNLIIGPGTAPKEVCIDRSDRGTEPSSLVLRGSGFAAFSARVTFFLAPTIISYNQYSVNCSLWLYQMLHHHHRPERICKRNLLYEIETSDSCVYLRPIGNNKTISVSRNGIICKNCTVVEELICWLWK